MGFARGAADMGLDAAVLNIPARASTEAGGRLLAEALRRPERVEGVACSNDLMALGALFECQRRGIRVPEDLAIIGFGDLGFGASCLPPLTTIRPPSEAIGREVGRRIQQSLARLDEPVERRSIDLGFELVFREST